MKRLKLKYGKEQIEFAFGLGFLGEFIDASGISLTDLQKKLENNPYKTVPLLMYHSYKWAIESKGKKASITLNSFIELIDENGGLTGKNTVDFLAAFAKSMTADIPDDEDKKDEKPKN